MAQASATTGTEHDFPPFAFHRSSCPSDLERATRTEGMGRGEGAVRGQARKRGLEERSLGELLLQRALGFRARDSGRLHMPRLAVPVAVACACLISVPGDPPMVDDPEGSGGGGWSRHFTASCVSFPRAIRSFTEYRGSSKERTCRAAECPLAGAAPKAAIRSVFDALRWAASDGHLASAPVPGGLNGVQRSAKGAERASH